MTKPRITIAADGRRGYPDVIQYETEDGTLHAVPPLDGSPYTPVVHDLETYELMNGTGMLGFGHSYLQSGEVVDNRDAARQRRREAGFNE